MIIFPPNPASRGWLLTSRAHLPLFFFLFLFSLLPHCSQALEEPLATQILTKWNNWQWLPLFENVSKLDRPVVQTSEYGTPFVFVRNDVGIIYFSRQNSSLSYSSSQGGSYSWSQWINTGLKSDHSPVVERYGPTFLFLLFDSESEKLTFAEMSIPGDDVLPSVPDILAVPHDIDLPEKEVEKAPLVHEQPSAALAPALALTDTGDTHLFATSKNNKLFASVRVREARQFGDWHEIYMPVYGALTVAPQSSGVINVFFHDLTTLLCKTYSPATGGWNSPAVVHDGVTDDTAAVGLRTNGISYLFRLQKSGVENVVLNAPQLPPKDGYTWVAVPEQTSSKLDISLKSLRFSAHQDSTGYLHVTGERANTGQIGVVRSVYQGAFSAPDGLAYTGESCAPGADAPACAPPRTCNSGKNAQTDACTVGESGCVCRPSQHELIKCLGSSGCREGDMCASAGVSGDRTCMSCWLVAASGGRIVMVDDYSNCGGVNVNDVPTPTPGPDDNMGEDDDAGERGGAEDGGDGEGSNCVAVHSMLGLHEHELVFPRHRRAVVLCDMDGNCATPGHIVVYKNRPMMMRTYCHTRWMTGEKTACEKKIMRVNSPRMQARVRIRSATNPELEYTAFAARYERRVEEMALSLLVWLAF